MELTPKTKLTVVLEEYPFLIEYLAGYNTKFAGLTNPVLRNTLAKTASLGRIATMGGIPVDELLMVVRDKIAEEAGDSVEISLGGMPVTREDRRQVLAAIIRDLHAGVDRAEIKARFNSLIEDVGAGEIGELEQSLIDAGMPEGELTKLCDVHMDIFRDSLQEAPALEMPPGHPVDNFLAENRAFTTRLDRLEALLGQADASPADIDQLLADVSTVDIHYIRKENQLFPYLEKYGISGPPQIMWATHDEIRAQLKAARRSRRDGDDAAFRDHLAPALQAIRSMIEKEDLVLWPMALEKLTDQDWAEMREGEDHIGYALVEPAADWPGNGEGPTRSALPEEVPMPVEHGFATVLLNLDTGTITPEQVNLLLNHLPVEISFTDEEHRVRYFSEGRERIFPRSPGVIGRHVEKCHPPKSVHMVREILQAFESGERDAAGFWLELNGRFIHIRYFAVRDSAGKFRGTLEVVQDVTEIRKLEGSRTLLEWE